MPLFWLNDILAVIECLSYHNQNAITAIFENHCWNAILVFVKWYHQITFFSSSKHFCHCKMPFLSSVSIKKHSCYHQMPLLCSNAIHCHYCMWITLANLMWLSGKMKEWVNNFYFGYKNRCTYFLVFVSDDRKLVTTAG